MGTTGYLERGYHSEAEAVELRTIGEPHDEVGFSGLAREAGAMIGLMLALAVFFVVFAPGA